VRSVLAALLLGLSGCFTGVLYTKTVRPLTLHLGNTPVMPGPGARGSLKQVRYSYFDVRFDSNAIGAIALANGLGRIYYADVEVLRVLIFTRTSVLVYGEPALPGPALP
jgi:hypothetical protein